MPTEWMCLVCDSVFVTDAEYAAVRCQVCGARDIVRVKVRGER